ncbi:mediator of RNA polymerase II transcription subunit 33A-like isoform X2 [Wolffia australiana]
MAAPAVSPPQMLSSHVAMATAAPAAVSWEEVVEFTKAAAENGLEAVDWGSRLSTILLGAGESLPSPGLAKALVSYVCWSGYNVPASWKYIEWALDFGLVPPALVIAHFSVRVLPYRRSRPAGYALYMEILKRHILKFAPKENRIFWKRILLCVDDLLHLSETFGISSSEPGIIVVEFFFYILWQLVDAALDDEGLLERTPEKKSYWLQMPQDMEIDGEDALEGRRADFSEKLRRTNTIRSIELVGMLLEQKLITRLLSLARQNMPSHWRIFTNRLQLFATSSMALRNASVSPDVFLNFTLRIQGEFHGAAKRSQFEELQAFTSLGGLSHGASHSSLWMPLDIYLEDSLDFSVASTNAIEIISGLVKTLRAINRTTWHEAFLGLWVAALRLVQRDRDPIEGPVPHLDSRFCMLLSVATLSIADIIREEELNGAENRFKDTASGERRKALMSSIRAVGEYDFLLSPPQSFVSEANQAAAKAMLFISEFNVSRGHIENISSKEKTFDCVGNMRHLIVEACIARNLLDTSVYFWPGYVTGRISPQPHAMPSQPGWSALMKGVPLSSSMINALMNTPASSLGELEKIFQIASNGSDDDRISATTILCGASLIRGWNFQEYTVRFIVRLLSPPVPHDYLGSDSHLISHAPVMYIILAAISTVDCVQIFSFHGLVPELAGALMAICEVFGSCVPTISWSLPTGEEVNTHAVFSNAFILLLRLWKFNHPPLEYCIMGDGAPVGSQLTPEYLLLLRNSYVLASSKEKSRGRALLPSATDTSPIFLDSFPKLKTWYMQHQACLASTLSGLVPGTPVHHNVDSLLSMMFRKLGRGKSVASVPSGSVSMSNSSAPVSEDYASLRPKLDAWDIMEAVPFVVDAALTACSHSHLSPRELATDLADYLPASIATIVSYFSAEVTRGVWEPAFMNGTDWPSPAAKLSTVEDHIKKIVATTGVDVPSLVTAGSSKARLPLPLAAFVSLTITYKLDSASVRFLYLAGPAMENLASSCPWPSMPIVAALWTQKVKRWTDFLTFSASRTIFHNNHDAVAQLLRSCFHAALGLHTGPAPAGVGSLLGHGFGSHFCGGLSPVAPGILYLRVYRCIKDILRLAQQILSVMIDSIELVAAQPGLPAAVARTQTAASVAAAFAWLAGGPRVVQSLFQEMLPSWFLVARDSRGGATTAVLVGHGLAHFVALCGMLAWGGPGGPPSKAVRKRRARVIHAHLEFMANAMDGNVSLGCGWPTWQAYVAGFLGLVVECAPTWIADVEPRLLCRLCSALQHRNEPDLALALLFHGGVPAMGAAAEHLCALYP